MKIDNTFILAASLALLGAPFPALAQNNGGGGNQGGGGGAAATTDEKPAATEAPANTDSGDKKTTEGGDSKSTPTGKGNTKTDDPKATNSPSASQPADTEIPPALTTSVASKTQPTTTFGAAVTGALDGPTLPTIVGVIPNYVAQVPVTAKNPFMQKSNLPEGTVFIAVGSALGLIGLICVAWRAIVAWSLRRSLRRSAMDNHYSDSKTMLGPSGGNSSGHAAGASRKKHRNSGLYTSQFGSSLSLDHLANGPGGGANRGSSTPNASLFFSPTAGSGALTGGQRGSNYLPAGYYSSAGGNSSQTNLGRRPNTSGTLGGSSPPSSPLPKPPSRGRLPTPHDSPRLGTSHSTHSSIAGLAAPPGQQRTPSTYLEDLFEQHPPPSSHGNRDSQRDSFGPGGSGRSRHSQYGRNY